MDHIVEQCRKGDRKAAEQIYKMFAAKMFAVCIQFSRDRAEAEDNLQDGFIRVFGAVAQYSGKGSFEGWMKRIFINTALEKYRKSRPLQLVEEYPDVEGGDLDDDIVVPGEVLVGFVEQLPEKYRLVFNLYVTENLSHKEIAALVGITEGTSKSNLARARDILKRKVREYLEHGQ